MAAIERFRIQTSGADLACARFGEGPPLVCAHAFAFSKEYFVSAADVLGARFSCVAFDQRGHGATTSESGTGDFALDALAGDIGAVMDHLGWPTATVGGISLGAATSLRFALKFPQRVTRLIQDLPAYGPTSPRDPAQARVADLLDAGDLEAALRGLTEGLTEIRARALAALLRTQWQPFADGLAPKLGALFRATFRWRVVERWPDDLAGLNMPVAILGLAGDPAHPIEVARAMAVAIRGAELRSRVPSLSAAAVAKQWLEVAGA